MSMRERKREREKERDRERDRDRDTARKMGEKNKDEAYLRRSYRDTGNQS